MKRLLWIALGAIIVGGICFDVDLGNLSSGVPVDAEELSHFDRMKAMASLHPVDIGPAEDKVASCASEEESEKDYLHPKMTVDGKVIGWGGYEMPMKLIFDGEVFSDNPLLRVDSVSPTVCELNMIARRQKFDLSAKGAKWRLRNFLKPIEGFNRFQKIYTGHINSSVNEKGELQKQNTVYTFTLDYPNEEYAQREPLLKWLCYMISIAQNMDMENYDFTDWYIGGWLSKNKGQIYSSDTTDINGLGKFAFKKAFSVWKDIIEDALMDVHIVTDYRAHIANERYVTYGAFVHSREVLAHGIYTETFYTYDLIGNQIVDNDYLFKKESMDKVMKLLFAEMAKDKSYQTFNQDVETAEEVEEKIIQWNKSIFTIVEKVFVMPEGALTNDGVVFSFQPYQIDCYAAGALHFIVPYSKLWPYLTTRAKNLINPQ